MIQFYSHALFEIFHLLSTRSGMETLAVLYGKLKNGISTEDKHMITVSYIVGIL